MINFRDDKVVFFNDKYILYKLKIKNKLLY